MPSVLVYHNFISFAVEQGWYDPDSGAPFNVMDVYANDEDRYPRNAMEQELRAAAPVSLRAFMNAVRDPRISKDSTGYGQVAELKPRDRSECAVQLGLALRVDLSIRERVELHPEEGAEQNAANREQQRHSNPGVPLQP